MKKIFRFKKVKILLFLVVVFGLGLVIVFRNFLIFKTTASPGSPDAIAVRVIPNTDHYSAGQWYQKQGFGGSTQDLIIDGYRAVRSGRTVYVDAANLLDSNNDGSLDSFYTNIYVLSYNQNPEQATVDIFSQLLSHWKFNINIITPGECSKDTSINCHLDSDCQGTGFCSSLKAKAVRDTKRLEDLTQIREALDNYYNSYGIYPTLPAGSYLVGKTVSSWPSWQEEFAPKLGGRLPIDPINQLGNCPGYNVDTCWDETNKKFADPTPDNGQLDLPSGSNAYYYSVSANGTGYRICAIMESEIGEETNGEKCFSK